MPKSLYAHSTHSTAQNTCFHWEECGAAEVLSPKPSNRGGEATHRVGGGDLHRHQRVLQQASDGRAGDRVHLQALPDEVRREGRDGARALRGWTPPNPLQRHQSASGSPG